MKSRLPSRINTKPKAVCLGEAISGITAWTVATIIVSLNLQSFSIGAAEIAFAPPGTFEHGHNTFGIVAADLDSDGDLDLSVANATCCIRDLPNENTASVALNNGDGTFAPAVNYRVGEFPVSIATGDINGDGSLDLALANQQSSDVSVLLNHGDGTFADPISTIVGGVLHSVITNDFNGDDVLDLSVANRGAKGISVLLGHGDGTFDQPVAYATGSAPVHVTAGDLNRDGRLDLITANSDSDNVSVLLANEDGTFDQSVEYAAAEQPMSVATADLDHDGDLDLAVANRSSHSVTIHLNKGDGSFADSQAFGAGGNANFVMAGDLDVDGNLDLAVANHYGGGVVSTLRGNGDGTFDEAIRHRVQPGLWFWSLTLADLDGDNDLDLAVPNSNTGNSGTNGTILFNTTEVTPEPIELSAGDADQDLDFDQLDLVQVQIAGKYLTNQPATWGEGDWNGAPGGTPGTPPPGDDQFNQLDIVAALAADTYLTGPYSATKANGRKGDKQTSVGYDARTGEVWVDTPGDTNLTSINIDSASSIFTGATPKNLVGGFDHDADGSLFKITFGGTFGSLSFGNVAQAGLSKEYVLGDLTVIGSLAGGGDLGDFNLIYVPEPSTIAIAVFGLFGGLLRRRLR